MEEIVITPKGGQAEKAIVFFHGYGKTKELFESVGQIFSRTCKDAAVYLPEGFNPCIDGVGYQWFSFLSDEISSWKDEYYAAEPKIKSYVDDILKKNRLTYDNLILSGFSQGAMVALLLGIRLNVRAIIMFSGQLIDLKISPKKNHSKILIVHGENDDVVPLKDALDTEKILKNQGFDVQKFVSKGTKHAIDIDMLKTSVNFLKEL